MTATEDRRIPGGPPTRPSRPRARLPLALAALATAVMLAPCPASADDDDDEHEGSSTRLSIERASWDREERRLRVSGSGSSRSRVTLVNAYDASQRLGSDETEGRDGSWSIREERPRPVPCRVRALQSDGQTAERDVYRAPSDCAPKAPGDENQQPIADANGPYSGAPGADIAFSSAGSRDPDGSISSYAWSFGDGSGSSSANPSHRYATPGTYPVSLTVTDDSGATSQPSTTTATVSDGPVVGCTSPIPEHCNITAYTGPAVCVECHQNEARDMHGSVHYQQGGAFDFVTNIPGDFAAAGERPAKAAGDLVATGINTYCGTHENSPRFTCAGCHVGNGRFPMAQSLFEQLDPASDEAHAQLANIDCLTCHQERYKRFPDWTASGQGFADFSLLNLTEDSDGDLVRLDGAALARTGFSGIPNVDPVSGDFQFLPAGSDTLPGSVPMSPMPITTLQAAQNVHATTRMSCLSCHAGAGGGDGTKRGDMAKENANPSVTLDMHMSPNGADLSCSDCHSAVGDAGESHRMRGRGLDLRPNDVQDRFTCETGGCHDDRPHEDFSNTRGSSRDKHAMRVACQTCHIPAYAKANVGTEVARDWQDPHPSAAACNGRGGWLPREDKGGLGSTSLIPTYAWFDGTSEVLYLEESLDDVPTVPLDATIAASFAGAFNPGDATYVLGQPNGDVASDGAKLYPMKPHWSKLARNDLTNTLVGHSTFEFFRTGSFCRAVAVGLGLDEPNAPTSSVCDGTPGSTETPPSTTIVPVFTYQTINHGVEPEDNALGGEARGCGSCHASLSGGPRQLDLEGLGYALRTAPSAVIGTGQATLNGNLDAICSQCHENEREDRDFSDVHRRHVQEEGKDCAACHNFSRPERGLSLSREERD
ncbi:PKD domain-containing protein [Thiorhodococcus minor]|uniref:PKD domain-containing protein n=1 Tax=Thiorhodococcus minor TaxID=57489 RepID=A0A6M0JXB7_9GAMM|nr:PKD domain-containing protein [Thiorhodococcus minor]NEV62186.1 PKD domain-containing protein [Thiorhodococcus minor]